MDMEHAWQLADLRRRGNALSSFVAAHTSDPTRAHDAKHLGDQLFTTDLEDLRAAQQIVSRLDVWAAELTDPVPPLAEPRPDESDRQARDYVRDVIGDRAPVDQLDWTERLKLFLDVTFSVLVRDPALPPRTREEVYYIYGRGTAALDLGHRVSAEHELHRLEKYSGADANPTP